MEKNNYITKKQLLIGTASIILVLILMGSTLLYSFDSEPKKEKTNIVCAFNNTEVATQNGMNISCTNYNCADMYGNILISRHILNICEEI